MAELRCEHLAKSYGRRRVLADVDLRVTSGTLTAILGASGSGKTTLLRVIMGFIEPDAGTVTVGGTIVANGGRVHLPADKRAIGYVAQEGALFPHLTRRRERRLRPSSRAAQAGRADRGGSRARRARRQLRAPPAARALGRRAAPGRARAGARAATAARAARRAVLRPRRGAARRDPHAVLSALRRDATTALLVTHDQGEALSMGNEVAVLRDGRLVQSAAPAELYRGPADADVARFVGDAVLLDGSARGGVVSCPLGRLPIAGPQLAGAVQAMIRPEQIQVRRLERTGATTSPSDRDRRRPHLLRPRHGAVAATRPRWRGGDQGQDARARGPRRGRARCADGARGVVVYPRHHARPARPPRPPGAGPGRGLRRRSRVIRRPRRPLAWAASGLAAFAISLPALACAADPGRTVDHPLQRTASAADERARHSVHQAHRDPGRAAHQRWHRARRSAPAGGQHLPRRRLPDRELARARHARPAPLARQARPVDARPSPGRESRADRRLGRGRVARQRPRL